MMNISIKSTDWSSGSAALRDVRTQVFVEEQSVPIELEWDDKDETASHWLAFENDKPIGTVRMLSDGHIGRMAVLKEYRGQGIGLHLLQAAINAAKEKNLYEVYLYSQTQAVDFYRQEGFIAHGEEFLDANIPHRTMRLKLAEKRLLGVHAGNFQPDNLFDILSSLISQTSQHLRILHTNLDPNLYDNEEMVTLLSDLARKSRYSDIRILIVDPSLIVKRGHRLLNLQRRLSSIIKLRRISCEPHHVKDNMVLADQCGIIAQPIKDPDKVWANFNNKPVATTHIAIFDDLWEHAVEDRNLRQLDI